MQTVTNLQNTVKYMDGRIVVVLEIDGKQKLLKDYEVINTTISESPVKLLILKGSTNES
ncbi:MAG: hypothetical protein J7L15_08310 [Clostridiales bacterium]|nr:hypothetical protein [Clostridiales bacterium]